MSSGPPPLPLIPLPDWLGRSLGPSEDADKSAPAAGGGAGAPKWTEADIKAEWAKTERGKEILKNLPPDTKFKAYEKKAGEERNAFYRHSEKTIYIPSSYTSAEAAPTAGHEAVHADQRGNHGRPKNDADRLEMEVEAKNAGLDVYEQMGRPALPYDYQSEADMRKKDPKAYDDLVRETYRKHYGIK